ncbi:MAG: ABC transporter ATP-binding protein [Candidatus Ranarchaeia archaeon]|jgi:putative ABC transport system ATP-binding protein
MAKVLELTNVKKRYMLGKVPVDALRGVNLTVETGDFIAVLGPSGSGKSTLLNLIGVLDTPTEGTLLVDGTDVSTVKENKLVEIRRKVGFVFQFFNLIPRLNARENVELPLAITNKSKSERRARALELLTLVGLRERAEHKPAELSGGEQQRVAIARALANKPKFLLLDEPTGNVDSNTANDILDLVCKLNTEEKATIIMVTHDHEIAQFAKKSMQMIDGVLH